LRRVASCGGGAWGGRWRSRWLPRDPGFRRGMPLGAAAPRLPGWSRARQSTGLLSHGCNRSRRFDGGPECRALERRCGEICADRAIETKRERASRVCQLWRPRRWRRRLPPLLCGRLDVKSNRGLSHVLPARRGGNVLTHSGTTAEKVTKFVVAAAIPRRGYGALQFMRRPISAFDAATLLTRGEHGLIAEYEPMDQEHVCQIS
jgi:hypothetical protein